MTRPVIDHIEIYLDGKWVTWTFQPLFTNQLVWAEDVKCPSPCPFSNHAHPMVRDEADENMYHKLCTLTVIHAGLLIREDIIGEAI